jgi:HAD superfamily hydrolase (TIGR01509 family)
MALDAMIFDVDGTLVDTNTLHVEAWRRSFESLGYQINADRIGVEVGKGGDLLVPSILGKQADDKDGDALRAQQPKEFKALAEEKGIKIFSGAIELLGELRRRKIKTVLATSSNKKQFETIEQIIKVKWREHVDDIVDADDIEKSKPHPDLVHAAVKKLGVSPAQCAMVGDTIWDAKSARGGGVVTVGVTSGGNAREDLYGAGARLVYRDVGDILDHLDEVLTKCSPGDAHLTFDVLDRLMTEAMAVARDAMKAGEAPIGCVLARGDGVIIARGHNEQNRSQNKTAHAEIVTFARAAGKVPLDAKDLVLACTLEPCVMCTGAAMESAVDTIVFALPAPADSGSQRVTPPQTPESQMPRMIGGIRQEQSRALFEDFLKTNPRPEQREYVEQLLASPLQRARVFS